MSKINKEAVILAIKELEAAKGRAQATINYYEEYIADVEKVIDYLKREISEDGHGTKD